MWEELNELLTSNSVSIWKRGKWNFVIIIKILDMLEYNEESRVELSLPIIANAFRIDLGSLRTSNYLEKKFFLREFSFIVYQNKFATFAVLLSNSHCVSFRLIDFNGNCVNDAAAMNKENEKVEHGVFLDFLNFLFFTLCWGNGEKNSAQNFLDHLNRWFSNIIFFFIEFKDRKSWHVGGKILNFKLHRRIALSSRKMKISKFHSHQLRLQWIMGK